MTSEFLRARRADVRYTRPWTPFAYVNKRLRELIRWLVDRADLPNGAQVLDYGCADRPYRDILRSDLAYIGADLIGNTFADITLERDGTVPVEDGGFDLVLSTQVLEHVEDPTLYLRESFRVLRPGGALALSTHGIMYFHPDPADHWRWTHTGLRRIVEEAGFQVVDMRGELGLAAASLQLFQDGTYSYLPRFLRPVFALLMQGLICIADRFYSDKERLKNALVFGVIARKPS